MIENKMFYTETMADVFRNQGLVDKARTIYQYLLKINPSQMTIRHKLDELQNRGDPSQHSAENTVFLLSQWIELLVRYQRIKRVKAVTGDPDGHICC